MSSTFNFTIEFNCSNKLYLQQRHLLTNRRMFELPAQLPNRQQHRAHRLCMLMQQRLLRWDFKYSHDLCQMSWRQNITTRKYNLSMSQNNALPLRSRYEHLFWMSTRCWLFSKRWCHGSWTRSSTWLLASRSHFKLLHCLQSRSQWIGSWTDRQGQMLSVMQR